MWWLSASRVRVNTHIASSQRTASNRPAGHTQDSEPVQTRHKRYITSIVAQPRLIPGIYQGTLIRTRIYTAFGTTFIQPNWIPTVPDPEFYIEDLFTQEEQQVRRAIRERYTRPLKESLYTLQVECLKAYSRLQEISIDSQEFYIALRHNQAIIFKIILVDSRPIPIHYHNLVPWSKEQLEEYIKPRFLEWYYQGGYHCYLLGQSEPFWIDLWNITETEPPIPEWFLPEVKQQQQEEETTQQQQVHQRIQDLEPKQGEEQQEEGEQLREDHQLQQT